jgi:predicted ATPase
VFFSLRRKTSLVDSLHKHVLRSRGLFARGKFDVIEHDSSKILQAFRHLLLQLLVHDALTWRVRLLRALGTNAGVLCEVLPELTRLIGEQPTVAPIGTAETATRFNLCFVAFVGALSSATSPLTLFLDDLQVSDC